MDINPTHYFHNLLATGQGIWTTPSIGNVSYPKGGHQELVTLEEESFWFRHRRNCILDAMKNHPPHLPIVDLGAGNGYMSIELQKAGFPVISIEPGADGVHSAHLRGVRSVVHSGFDDLEIKENSIPSLGIFDVLEHVEGDLEFLKKLQSYLIPNGRLYITVPAHKFLWSSSDQYAGHFRRYTKRMLKEVLEDAGFILEFSSYFFSVLVPPLFLTRTLPSLLSGPIQFTDRRNRSDHLAGKSILQEALSPIFTLERFLLSRQYQLPIGTSCLVVAKKAEANSTATT